MLSKAIVSLLKEKHGLKADATEAEAKELLDAKLKSGELSYSDISAAEEAARKSLENPLAKMVADALGPVLESVKTLGEEVKNLKTAKPAEPPPAPAPKAEEKSADDMEKALDALLAKREAEKSPLEVFRKAGVLPESAAPRVKKASEGYSSTRSNIEVKSPILAQNLNYQLRGRQPEELSQRDYALVGAWYKHVLAGLIRRGLPLNGLEITDHDKQLYAELIHEEKWVGTLAEGKDEIDGRKLRPAEVKALLDDSTSGGQEAVPLVYDNRVITTAILTGQLWPFVNMQDLARGNKVHAYSLGRPTIQANVNEGTAITLFDTTGLIAALDTNIYTSVGAMEIGLDWEEDSPVNVGQMIVMEYGQAAANYLDKIVAVGDGTTQATGIFTASNTIKVLSTGGVGSGMSFGDFQSLYFGITKEERERKPAYWAWVGSDGTYQRAQAVPVGPSDARRLFNAQGVNAEPGLGGYNLMGYPYKVSHSCTDSQLAYCNLQRYRAYRRLGTTFRYETAGQTLGLKNTALIILRMRQGGQPELGAGFAIMPNAPTG